MTNPISFIEVLTAPAIKANRCVEVPYGCGEPLNGFTSELSQDEYFISGFCQSCQNKVFGEDSEEFNEYALTQEDEDALALYEAQRLLSTINGG